VKRLADQEQSVVTPDFMVGNRRTIFYLLFTLIWMAVIFAFSNQAYSGRITEAYLGQANVPIRKLGHVSEFAFLSFLYFQTIACFRQKSPLRPAVQATFALLLAFLYACTDEWHQSYVPGRSASFSDVLVDTSGVVIAQSFILFFIWWRRKKDLSAQLP